MGKSKIIISGLNLHGSNRGTAALGYGAINFCFKNGILKEEQEIISLKYVLKIWEKKYKDKIEFIPSDGKKWIHRTVHIPIWEYNWLIRFGYCLPFSKLHKLLNDIELIACINGGDGFSDIYGTKTFLGRLPETNIAIKTGIDIIQLPQTLGPFKGESNYYIAEKILRYSKKVFVRDLKFAPELEKMGIKFELTKDLSAYMQPEPWDIDIIPNSIGINISGLAYSNEFRGLERQFDFYPELINCLITHFTSKGKTVYLIPHSYIYGHPDLNNDDMDASKKAYKKLVDKKNVVFVDKDLTSPQVKYVISKMAFFCGTRMHANFAAIYSKVPVFGLAYSYKFEGAFNANGLDGQKQTAMINNIKKEQIADIITKIESFYNESVKN